jgi:hypothetical protein
LVIGGAEERASICQAGEKIMNSIFHNFISLISISSKKIIFVENVLICQNLVVF